VGLLFRQMTAMKIPQQYFSRQDEITESFLREMNKHIDDFMAGTVEDMFHLKDITNIMCLHPIHVTNVIKLKTGFHPCYFYEMRILNEAKKLLQDFSLTIGDVATRLTYDNSNFTKFFKQYAGITPSEYRRQLAEGKLLNL
jgi:transcriptional regulator GlxA family with amidase domain